MCKATFIYETDETDAVLTYEDIFKVIHKLKSKNSTGPDGLSSAFLKKVASSISSQLVLFFTVFSAWKYSGRMEDSPCLRKV